ncbi:hypothetical protein SBA4_4090016 [Candidatus Sulfopaludibacter sp. SbA4]|nr:hypothetical protein SBA4_4090016 [Candidatus Sulfopaludibacter sp. SbA4]
MGLHARDQLARAEGLGHVVVAADFEAQHAVHLVRSRGEKQDRGPAQHGRLADQPAQLEAVYLGKHDVQQDEVRLGLFQGFESALGAVQKLGLIALPAQVVIDERGQLVLVFHDSDSLGHSGNWKSHCTVPVRGQCSTLHGVPSGPAPLQSRDHEGAGFEGAGGYTVITASAFRAATVRERVSRLAKAPQRWSGWYSLRTGKSPWGSGLRDAIGYPG